MRKVLGKKSIVADPDSVHLIGLFLKKLVLVCFFCKKKVFLIQKLKKMMEEHNFMENLKNLKKI